MNSIQQRRQAAAIYAADPHVCSHCGSDHWHMNGYFMRDNRGWVLNEECPIWCDNCEQPTLLADTMDYFFEHFQPIHQPESTGGFSYDDCSPVLDELPASMMTRPEYLWTVLDCDGAIVVVAGLHFVNREGFIVTNKAWITGDETFTILHSDECEDMECPIL